MSLAVAGVIVFFWNAEQQRFTLPQQLTSDEASQQAQAAFNNYDIDADPTLGLSEDEVEHYESFTLFLAEFERASQENDTNWLEDIVDVDLLFARIGEVGNLRKWDFFSRQILRQRVIEFESQFTCHLELAKLQKLDESSDLYMAHLFGYDESESEQVEWRFWLRKTNNSWKLFDWERLDLGLSQSAEYGYRVRYAERPSIDNFNAFIDKVIESDAEVKKGDWESAKAALRRANPANSPSELMDSAWLLVAYRWMALGEYVEALNVLDKVSDADRSPGVYSARASIYQLQNQYDEALENTERYEAVLGKTPQISQMKAEILNDMGRTTEALAAYRAVLQQKKAGPQLLANIANLSPEFVKTDLIAWLERQPQPSEAALEIATNARYSNRAFEILSSLEAFVRQSTPETAEAAWIAGCLAELDDDLELAADHFRKAMQRTSHSERKRYADELMSVMIALGKPLEGYAEMPDKVEAFATLAWNYEDGTSELSEDHWNALVDQHRQQFPNDIQATDHWISHLLEQERWSEAEEELQAAAQRFASPTAREPSETTTIEDEPDASTSDDEREIYISGWEAELMRLQARVEPAATVYKNIRASQLKNEQDMEVVFHQLAGNLVRRSQWSELGSLIEEHKQKNENDPRIAYYASEAKAAEQDWESAYLILNSVKSRLADDNTLRYMVNSRLARAAGRTDRWRVYYREAENKSLVFESLADVLSRQGDGKLAELISEHQQTSMDDPAFAIWMANHAWENQETQRFLTWSKTVAEHAKAADESNQWESQRIADRRRSLLVGVKLYEEAREEFGKDPQSTALVEAMILADQGEHSRAAPLALQYADAAKSSDALYEDQVLGWLWFRPEYHELHQKFPPRIHDFFSPPQYMVFLREPMELDIVQVERAAARAFGREFKVSENDITERADRSNLFTIQAIDKPEFQNWHVQQIELPTWTPSLTRYLKEDIREALMASGSCLLISRSPVSLGYSFAERRIPESELAPAMRFLEDLARDRAAAWYGDTDNSVLLPSVDWAFQTSTNPQQVFFDHGSTTYLPSPKRQITTTQQRLLAHELRKRLLHESHEKKMHVQICVRVGWLEEPLWLETIAAERVAHEVKIRCKLLSNSILAPNITSGTVCEVDLSEVTDWRWESEAEK
ncbi:MAG: hypothetical protein Q8M16_15110 [Pirellulaceae bacterium]|nr:hypothetical protein [Pirellulaceae bacterium]